MSDDDRFERAEKLFELVHEEDPRRTLRDGESLPFAVLYHRALLRWVCRLSPNASEALRLAALCQHIRRHTVPRQSFPMDLVGYKRWRSSLAQMHAAEARIVLSKVGYEEATIDRVTDLLVKKGLKKDPEVALFEDAICLVFLELELSTFAEKHPEEKVIAILQKTWAKMTKVGKGEALVAIETAPEALRRLVVRAVGA